jgi:hypothetical protein
MQETNNILAILDNYLHDNPDEIAKEMANDFRKRRIEKNLTRQALPSATSPDSSKRASSPSRI